MAMEKPIALENFRVGNGSINSYGGEAVQASLMLDDDVKESENPENGILEDLDSYWEDINDRLTISRMVSDSVIKGMVSAVEQEAAKKIAQKELELARLKETLNLYHVGADGSESSGSLLMQHEQGSIKHGPYSSSLDGLFDFDRIEGSLGSIKNVAKEQLKNLRKEIDRMRGSCSIRRIGSGSEMVGLSGILQDKVSDIKWMDVDKTLDSLRTTLDSIFKQVDDMVYLSKTSLFQWQQEKEFQGEIEDMVIMNFIRSLKEEFEGRLWDQNAQFYDNENLSGLEKIREISNLRQELDVISKSLSVPDIGHISSHGSMEIGEDCNNHKGSDYFHRKVSGNHVSLSTSLWEGNGKHDEPIIAVPENLEYAQLKHMSKEELVSYFKTEMTKMKRNHEHIVQEMTEEHFSLKREFLRERGSSLPLKKDKDFDTLRKKIPEVILRLDEILVENEKLPAFSKNAESLCSLKNRLESLLSENHQLRGMITDKKREVKRLTSDTAEIMLQHSLSEATLVKRIGNLQSALEDARIEASISEDVYKCLLREVVDSSTSVFEQSDMESRIMQEVYETIFKEAAYNAGPSSMCEFEDSDMVFIIMQGLCGLIFRESLKEAKETLNDLNLKYVNEKELRVNLEKEALQKEKALNLEVAEKERSKQKTLLLSSLMEEKEKQAQEAAAELVKEKERFELVSVELNDLRDKTSQQEIVISKSSEESNAIELELGIALERIELQKMEMNELKHRLKMTMLELRESDEERMRLQSVSQERQNAMALVEAKEREHRKQMQTVIILVQCLFQTVADFEDRVMEDINRSNIRLRNLSSQYRALIQKAKVNKATELMYKQRLERKYSDLQKAEAEVDLLGDEVDALLSLLEKIYIALDHYSPILQHYPGIMEILKLVRRELSGESIRPA